MTDESEASSEVLCLCSGTKTLKDNDQTILGCDGCQIWFHIQCLNISEYECSMLPDIWYCPKCTAVNDLLLNAAINQENNVSDINNHEYSPSAMNDNKQNTQNSHENENKSESTTNMNSSLIQLAKDLQDIQNNIVMNYNNNNISPSITSTTINNNSTSQSSTAIDLMSDSDSDEIEFISNKSKNINWVSVSSSPAMNAVMNSNGSNDNMMDDGMNDDLVVVRNANEMHVNSKCPLTLKTIDNELFSTRCMHVYEAVAIQSYIAYHARIKFYDSTHHIKCPVVGCECDISSLSLSTDRPM